ncbi:MAG: hypothetical protein HeimC3_21700 [Candidatus Heimdallarchaeota archaeon LC_3]|nr:MAG: hypothetical protein HeimC3_21700 [Candidatus Heimdallarchaeota archaeon LC_3]
MSNNKFFQIIGGSSIAIAIFLLTVIFFNPLSPLLPIISPNSGLLPNTASNHKINTKVITSFAEYNPLNPSFTAQIVSSSIQTGLSNVDFQGLSIPSNYYSYLEEHGFVLVESDSKQIYTFYSDTDTPKYITTDIALHAFHVLFDLSLRILETNHFYYNFESLLYLLRTDQRSLLNTLSESSFQDALLKNIAYLSVMLHLIDPGSYPIPYEVQALTQAEIDNINSQTFGFSSIFGYKEDYSQYIVRGHYTRTDLLEKYFQSMMYAGRMSFLLQGLEGEVDIGIDQTRMALLLLSSFNSTTNNESGWDLWNKIYNPTVFYVGTSDDLTPKEYHTLWSDLDITLEDLSDDIIVLDFITKAKSFRKPKINSMIISDQYEAENVTQGFRLMGQRFIPDSYIFQQLVHTKVKDRLMPTALDVFSVFGSPRAEELLLIENQTYHDYNGQIQKLREEFNNLTDQDWTQNLYWLWVYTLFPLLKTDMSGYPGYMNSPSWVDKSLMTALSSWVELRHDTILYAKQSYTQWKSVPPLLKGYVEPYPDLYSRLSSLVKMMKSGLESRGLIDGKLLDKMSRLSYVYDNLTALSIKELTNQALTEEEYRYINDIGTAFARLASFDNTEYENIIGDEDSRMAVVADVHTDPNRMKVLQVATGNPYIIYVIVQDNIGNLYLTKGATYSYYEFTNDISTRLTDGTWHDLLESNQIPIPGWLSESLPLIFST